MARPGGSLVLVADLGDARTITAFDFDYGPIESEAEQMHALVYDQGLSELGLSAGSLLEDPEGRALPVAQAYWRATVDAPEWQQLQGPPTELEDLRLAVPTPCVPLVARTYTGVGISGALRFAIRAGPNAALLLIGNDYYVAGPEGIEPLGLPDLPHGFGYYDASSQEMWLFGPGETVRGTLGGGFEPAPTLPVVPVAVDGERSTAEGELYAVTASIALWRLASAGWEEISPSRGGPASGSRISVARIGWRHALLTGIGRMRLLEHLDGTNQELTVSEETTSVLGDGLSLVRYLPSYGPVLGTKGGALLSLDNQRWKLLVRPQVASKVLVAEPFGGGLLYGGEDGVLNQYWPATDCPAITGEVYSNQAKVFLIPLESALLLLASSPPPADLRVTVLR